MGVFLVVFVMFIGMIALMAVGVVFKRSPISGSCGGLGNIGVEKACDCDKPCEKRLAKMREKEEQVIHLQK